MCLEMWHDCFFGAGAATPRGSSGTLSVPHPRQVSETGRPLA